MITPLTNTRVLKAHVQAVLDAFENLKEREEKLDKEEVAKFIAGAVVTATDTMTRYTVIVTEAPQTVWIYGPYATYQAASKALESGFLGTREGARGYVLPLIPAPKIPRKKK